MGRLFRRTGFGSAQSVASLPSKSQRRLAFLERFLSLWVLLCMVAGVIVGRLLPSAVQHLQGLEFGKSSQINVPIAVLIWLMITPMMMKVDFGAIRNVGRKPAGLLVTLFVNWLLKPFSMAFLAWLFFRSVFAAFLAPAEADQYIAGCIILAAAPCTAMVFVWSHLTEGDAAYTLVQVSVNDLIMLVLFAPIVQFLVTGASSLTVPFRVLVYSVFAFIAIPLSAGAAFRIWLTRKHGRGWVEKELLPKLAPVTMAALLATLVLIFAFQSDNILNRSFHVLLIAVPITMQVYWNASIAYGLMWILKVEHSVAAPGALIGASNFFELAVATAIALFGPESGAALATVVGVLVEVPLMLSVCSVCNRTRHWFRFETGELRSMGKKKVLILCTGNSARSQMAEGLLRHEAGDRFEVYSAGTNPGQVRAEAVAVMNEIGIDIGGHRSKSVEEFAGHEFDYVITVCDNARDACPVFPGSAQRLHWPLDDPAAVPGTEGERLAAFREVRNRIHARWMVFLGKAPPSFPPVQP